MVFLDPAAGQWLLTDSLWRKSNQSFNAQRQTLLAHVGYAHLMRGAWLSLEKQLHDKVMEPLFEHDAVVLRSLLGVMRLPSRDLSQELGPELEPLPLFAVPRQLSVQLAQYCESLVSLIDDESQPAIIATVPLLGLAPTEAMVPPILSLFCMQSPAHEVCPSQDIDSLQVADAIFAEFLTMERRDEALGEAAVFHETMTYSPLLSSSQCGPWQLYNDPVLCALNQSGVGETKRSAAILREALASVGANALATANAPRLGQEEHQKVQHLLQLKKAEREDLFSRLGDVVIDDIASITTETDPLEAQRKRVLAHNTPATPYRSSQSPLPPACPRCGGAQVHALTFCVLRDTTEVEKRRADMQLPSLAPKPKKPVITATPEPLYFSYPAHTCLACYPASLAAGESLRKVLLAECGAIVSVTGGATTAMQEKSIQQEFKPPKSKPML